MTTQTSNSTLLGTLREFLKSQGLGRISPVRESKSNPGVHVLFAYQKDAETGAAVPETQVTLNFSKALVKSKSVHNAMALEGAQLDHFVVYDSVNADGEKRLYIGTPIMDTVSIDDL